MLITSKSSVQEDGDVVTIKKSESEIKVHKYGATIISWKHKGREMLYVSPLAKLDGSKAIRGGIPIVFPRFGPSPLFPNQQHGFARNSKWRLCAAGGDECVQFKLAWKKEQFEPAGELVLSLKIGDNDELILSLTPKFDKEDAEYHVLLHSYFLAADARVEGLESFYYGNKQEEYQKQLPTNQPLQNVVGLDRMYFDVESKVFLKNSQGVELVLESEGVSDVVVWNPGKEMADVPAQDIHKFVCIEHGFVSKLQTEPRTFSVSYKVNQRMI